MQINFVAAVLVAISSMVIGFIWYSKILFANMWMKETGINMEEMNKGPGIGYLFTALTALVMGVVFSFLVHYTGTLTAADGLFLGALMWAGFIAPAFVANYMFAGKSFRLLAIDAGYFLFSSMVAGVIVSLVR